MGTGPVKVSVHTTFNIQGVWQRDPSVLHDSVDSVLGGGGGQGCTEGQEAAQGFQKWFGKFVTGVWKSGRGARGGNNKTEGGPLEADRRSWGRKNCHPERVRGGGGVPLSRQGHPLPFKVHVRERGRICMWKAWAGQTKGQRGTNTDRDQASLKE